MRSCPSCGGQFGPHTTVCPWCGHNVTLGMLGQLAIAAALLLGIASLTGVVDWHRVAKGLPWPGGVAATPDAPRRQPQATGLGDGKPLLERAFDAVPTAKEEGSSRSTDSRQARSRNSACGVVDSTRIRQLERQYGWDRQVLELISCGRVRRGFTRDQVQASLGTPSRVVRSASGREEWIYGRIRVTVQDGEVVNVER